MTSTKAVVFEKPHVDRLLVNGGTNHAKSMNRQTVLDAFRKLGPWPSMYTVPGRQHARCAVNEDSYELTTSRLAHLKTCVLYAGLMAKSDIDADMLLQSMTAGLKSVVINIQSCTKTKIVLSYSVGNSDNIKIGIERICF